MNFFFSAVDTVPLSQICHPLSADKTSMSSTSGGEQVVETSLLIAKHSGAGMCCTATAVDCASSPAVATKISTTISTAASGRQRSPSNNRTSAVASFVASAADALATILYIQMYKVSCQQFYKEKRCDLMALYLIEKRNFCLELHHLLLMGRNPIPLPYE
uniref:Uncharacterized protein n=1 Tax=Romanomermis culicivorax TaxID=13658 RepID=A0A915IEQ8_ROMCU